MRYGSRTSSPTDAEVSERAEGLSAQQLDRVFPFSMRFDDALVVTRLGPGLSSVCPACLHAPLADWFVVSTPIGVTCADDLLVDPGALVHLRARHHPLLLRGHALPTDSGGALFLGAPWIPTAEELRGLREDTREPTVEAPPARTDAGSLAARAADRARTEFLATLSHEIRTPLHAMLGMAELAMTASSPPEAHACLQRVQRNGELLLARVNGMLNLSRVDGGPVKTDTRAGDPRAPLEAARQPDGRRRLTAVERAFSGPSALTEDERSGVWLNPLRRPRILVVDDTIDNRNFAERVFRRAGYLVDLAADGEQAIAAARAVHYALILMDLEMPVRDGFEASRAIRAAQAAGDHHTPIVALSAHTTDGYRQRCLDAGMDDYFTKPASRPQLLAIASRWIDPRPSVLIVDDSPDSRLILLRFLEKDGRTQVWSAPSGEHALELMGRRAFDLVLMDLELPGLSGVNCARELRRLTADREMPILAVTGHDLAEARNLVLGSGVSDILVKPVPRAVLLDAVERSLALEASP